MCHVKQSSDLMFQCMGSEISSDNRATACQPVMRQTSCPHYFRTCIIVLRIIDQNSCILNYRTHQTLCNTVCDLHISTICKIAFHRMHQNVCASACCLIIRQCHGQFRIHDCKARSSIVIAVSSLDPAVFFCNNRRITHLTSCRCNSQYNTNRKTSCCLALFVIKIPYVPFIGNSISDCFCRIDRTSAAYSKDEIYSFFFRELDSFIYQ